MDEMRPHDHAEAVAVFRSQVIGALICRMLTRGELRAELCRLSKVAFRPPGAKRTRTYSVPTLERWYYAWRRDGLKGLRPRRRGDAGRARALTDAQRTLLLDIRREYAHASAELVLRTLVGDGRLEKDIISAATLRRLYADHGLPRVSLRRQRKGTHTLVRLRWQMAEPNMLWHADVCHAPPLVKVDGERRPVRIHAVLDDASRAIIAINAFHTEEERDMLDLLVPALRRQGRPDTLYLDNGSTYRGDLLAVACARLDIALVHAQPYDPEARGTMERFWRTLREGLLDFTGACTSLHDVNVRLWAFVERHYHRAPHAGLMGRSPEAVFAERRRSDVPVTEVQIRDALTVRARRRVRRDSTLSIDGRLWETDRGFLAGRTVTVARCHLTPADAPWIEFEGKRFALRSVDPVANSQRPRDPKPAPERRVRFDPPTALLDEMLGRKPRHDKEDT